VTSNLKLLTLGGSSSHHLQGEAYCGGPTTGRTALLQYVMFVFDVDRPFGVYDRCAVIAEKIHSFCGC